MPARKPPAKRPSAPTAADHPVAKKPPRQKPKKPAGCPLTPHPGGQWVARVAGKYRYFGKWADLDGALERYHATQLAAVGGKPVESVVDPNAAEGATVGDVCDLFLAAKEAAVASGEMRRRTFDEYRASCKELAKFFGRLRRVATLTPTDFSVFRATLAAKWGPVRLGNVMQRVRTAFKFAHDFEHIDRPVKFGPNFKRPSARALRERRNAAGARVYTADQIRLLLDRANPALKAMILLGVNAGFGATDVAELPIGAVDLEAGWINFPRPKTAQPRRVPLWPETVAALRVVDASRRKAKDKADAGLFFICRTGRRYVRYVAESGATVDGVAELMKKLSRPLGLPARFYDLRRTHRTVSDEAGDQVAAAALMGHVPHANDMSAVYRQRISDDRLRHVAEYVRSWLFSNASAGKPAFPSTSATNATPGTTMDPSMGWSFTTTTTDDLSDFSLDDLSQ